MAGSQTRILRQYAEATLGSGSLRQAVKLPEGEDLNEWIAVHVVDFYNQINMLYGTITEFCSPASCPKMSASDAYEYLWQDTNSPRFKRPTKVSAPEYVEHLMAWVQAYLDDENYFPTKMGVGFAKGANAVFRQILKRLFRVYAHIYCHHFEQICELGVQSHLNTSLKHFVLFSNEFALIDEKEFGPLMDLITMLLQDDSSKGTSE